MNTINTERNPESSIYIANIDEKVNESLLIELFSHVGPVVNVHIPRDRISGTHSGYAFVEFNSPESAAYAANVMNLVKLFAKPLKINLATQDRKGMNDVGATIWIGNLSGEVDERLLYDTFSKFGMILQTPRISRDPVTGESKGHGFISFDCFEASDAAISGMNGQFLCNRPIVVQYALKKSDVVKSATGPGGSSSVIASGSERHGSEAERLLAEQGKKAFPHLYPSVNLINVAASMAPATSISTNKFTPK